MLYALVNTKNIVRGDLVFTEGEIRRGRIEISEELGAVKPESTVDLNERYPFDVQICQ